MILGIDLGTSNSLAAIYKDGKVHMIPNSTGGYVTPSVVNVDENGVFYTGEIAKNRKNTHSGETVDMFKRSMGTEDIFTIGNMNLKAEELSAIILKSIKNDAENYLNENVSDVIISVPAFFNNYQREAVLRAGALAGLNVKKIINEPTSAALAYGVREVDRDNEHVIMVLDLGGGTFDISIMEVDGDTMEVISVCGDNNLGGRDFTEKLIELFLSANNIIDELTEDEKSKLWVKAEKAKCAISNNGKGDITCDINGNTYNYEITEEEYEEACFDLLSRIRALTLRAVAESSYMSYEIKDIIMVGGGTKLSIVKKAIEKMTDKQIEYRINPDEAVVIGAAIQGALMERNENVRQLVMTDICPYYIMSIEEDRRLCDLVKVPNIIINKNVTVPVKYSETVMEYPGAETIEIYQSEDRYGENKIKIGECKYVVPSVKAQTCKVVKSAVFDNNGILRYEVYIPAVKKTYSTTILSDRSDMDEKEINKKLEELNNLQLADVSEDELIMARLENLYVETVGNEREKAEELIAYYEDAVKTGKKSVINEARDMVSTVLAQYEL